MIVVLDCCFGSGSGYVRYPGSGFVLGYQYLVNFYIVCNQLNVNMLWLLNF
jgi:hypothetical protein